MIPKGENVIAKKIKDKNKNNNENKKVEKETRERWRGNSKKTEKKQMTNNVEHEISRIAYEYGTM